MNEYSFILLLFIIIPGPEIEIHVLTDPGDTPMPNLRLATLLIFTTLAAAAQQLAAGPQQPALPPTAPPAGSNWQHIQALPSGTNIYLTTRSGTMRCTLTAVDADSLTCTRGKSTVFQRSEIKTVKLPHRGRSTAILGGVGAGLGVAVVKGLASSWGLRTAKGSVYAGGAGIGAVVFGPIGYFTDFARSTVYRAP
jgi:hypothetical protein